VVREAKIQRHQIWIYDGEIGEVFVYSAYDFMIVGLGQPFER
jgi:hypothetical protein